MFLCLVLLIREKEHRERVINTVLLLSTFYHSFFVSRYCFWYFVEIKFCVSENLIFHANYTSRKKPKSSKTVKYNPRYLFTHKSFKVNMKSVRATKLELFLTMGRFNDVYKHTETIEYVKNYYLNTKFTA